MGKKKVAKQSEAEVLKEAEGKVAVKAAAPSGKRVQDGRIYIKTSFNNTMITVTDNKGNVLSWMTAGSLGFSGPKKATPFVASKIASAIFEKIEKTGPFNVDVFVQGVGSGRDAAIRSFIAKGLNINSIKDITPIPHNGPRPKKVRRV